MFPATNLPTPNPQAIHCINLGVQGIHALAAAPLAALTSLHLLDCRDGALQQLASAPWYGRLRALHLSAAFDHAALLPGQYGGVDLPEIAAVLIQGSWIPVLEELSLQGLRLGGCWAAWTADSASDDVIGSFYAQPPLKLRSLHLSNFSGGLMAATAAERPSLGLLGVPWLNQLEKVTLEDSNQGLERAIQVLAARPMGALHRLVLRQWGVKPAVAGHLVTAPWLRNLGVLEVEFVLSKDVEAFLGVLRENVRFVQLEAGGKVQIHHEECCAGSAVRLSILIGRCWGAR